MALQDNDNLIIGRGTDSYKITYENLKEKLEEDGLGGASKPINPTPGDGNNTITPNTPGSGTELDPYILTAAEVEFGGSTQTIETISFSNQKVGALVQFVDQNSSTNGARYTQPIGVIGADGTWSGKLLFSDTPESTDETEFVGLLKIGESSIYYQWKVAVKSAVTINQPTVIAPPDGAGVGGDVTYTPKTSVITTVANNDTLTLTDAKTYNNDGGADMGQPISETFTAGQKVYGIGGTGGGSSAETAAFTTTIVPGTGGPHSVDTGVNNKGKALLWQKNRVVGDHILRDTEQGVNWRLKSHQADKAQEITNGSGVIEFTDTGFKYGGPNSQENEAGNEYATWNFRGAPGFFDIVTWDGDGEYRNIPHSLGTAPGMVIVKRTSANSHWSVWHKSLNLNYQSRLRLNSTTTIQTGESFWGTLANQTVDFNADTFSVGDSDEVNGTLSEYVAYVFADNPDGGIKCGSYTKTSGQSRVEIDCGFKPGWVLVKDTEGHDWFIFDNKRGTNQLSPNDAGEEEDEPTWDFTISSTGFSFAGDKGGVSLNDRKHVYVAIAENATAGEFGPTGTLTANADDDTKTITLKDVTGKWEDGMEVVNKNEVTKTAPGADVLEFVGSTPQDDPDGSVTTWGNATWQVSTDPNFISPMEATKLISDPDTNQVLLASERGTITLAPDTTYWVRVKYAATDPDVESIFSRKDHKFKTSASFRSYDEFNQQYYDQTNAEGTTGNDLAARFGIDPTEANLKQLGIAELTEQPTGPVLAYVPKGDEYIPVPDQSAEIASLTSSLSEARSRLASIEADEINDDATDTALLTLLGNLNSRLTALEENN